ncbi:hypothetical protein Scep_001302 [Stephania cephalantha]|uniref:Reverse transcriptase Ty1/copia-type domain-containing protein n=1 Tax=Stephania cephalantha TaxID=152367 RepID=A0AAP0L845_9MAGN
MRLNYSPVIKSSIVRVILTLASSFNWLIKQLDVNNAFLHGHLSETMFIPQPVGFVDTNQPHHVYQLHKALYGLRQAPRAWFDQLRSSLSWGFRNSTADTSLFIHKQGSCITYLLIYVDNILLTGSLLLSQSPLLLHRPN